jgi:type II secretory pathway component HofQ
MTNLIQQIEEMRTRMNELAAGEQELVRALGEALSRTDQKLLEDVRTAAADHEARRGAILTELQSLAARMGALPRPREPYAALTEAPQRAVRLGGADGALPRPEEPYDALTAAALELPKLARRGDWRQAAANIEDAGNNHLMGRASAN